MTQLLSLTALVHVFYVTILLFGVSFLLNLVFKLARVVVNRIPNGNKFIRYLSAIGVVHHELSHALLYTLTGAKVTKIKLFQAKPGDSTLGYVEAILRGPKWLHGVQEIMSGLGPVIMGYITLYLMIAHLRPFLLTLPYHFLYMIPYYYTLVCIFMHCTLSDVDMEGVKEGLKSPLSVLFVLLIIYIFVCVCIIFRFRIIVPGIKLMRWIKQCIILFIQMF